MTDNEQKPTRSIANAVLWTAALAGFLGWFFANDLSLGVAIGLCGTAGKLVELIGRSLGAK